MGNCQSYNDEELSKFSSNSRGRLQLIFSAFSAINSFSLLIKTETWLRDSYGLFDYENTNLICRNFKSYSTGKVMRTGTTVSFLKDNESLCETQTSRELLQVQMKDGNFWVSPPEEQQALEEQIDSPLGEDYDKAEAGLWIVVKTLKGKNTTKGCPLSEGDLIKFGRAMLKVVELKRFQSPRGPDIEIAKRSGTEPDSPMEDDETEQVENKLKTSFRESDSQICRICLSNCMDDDTNPLFSPCKCSGTMKYVHIKCLQTWLKSKLHVKELVQVMSYYIKTLECELCKTPYPDAFKVGNTKYEVVEFERPSGPYMILEVLNKDGNNTRSLHVVKMDKKNSVKLGRGHESDIRITDISVSRFHAVIKMDKDGFYLEDNSSKFGTLIYMKRPFPIFGGYENVSVQVGRTVISFGLKRSWKMFSSCLRNPSINQVGALNEPKVETKESVSRPSQKNSATANEIGAQASGITNPNTGFRVRSSRQPGGPQRPLEGDDAAEMEEGVNRYQNSGEYFEDNGDQGRDLEAFE